MITVLAPPITTPPYNELKSPDEKTLPMSKPEEVSAKTGSAKQNDIQIKYKIFL